MDSLEQIIGTTKFNSLNDLEKRRINEILTANPIYVHLVSGILADPDWRRVLGQAYIEYVRPIKAVAQKKAPQKPAEKNLKEKSVIFGIGDRNQFTKSKVML